MACPECGADEETGWDANPFEPDEGALDLPDYLTEDYDPRRDGPILPGEAATARGWRLAAAVVALLTLLAFALALF